MTTFIYGLRDPITTEIRYVGKSNNPQKRLSKHICEARLKTDVHRLAWIKSLLDVGRFPVLEILEEVDINVWGQKETEWMGRFSNLTNMIDGGKFCPMTIPELVEKMRKSQIGKKLSATTKEKLSAIRKNEWAIGKRKGRKQSASEKLKRIEIMKRVWLNRSKDEIQRIGNLISKAKIQASDENVVNEKMN